MTCVGVTLILRSKAAIRSGHVAIGLYDTCKVERLVELGTVYGELDITGGINISREWSITKQCRTDGERTIDASLP